MKDNLLFKFSESEGSNELTSDSMIFNTTKNNSNYDFELTTNN